MSRVDEVPGFRHLMRAFYAESLGSLDAEEALADVERHAAILDAVLHGLALDPGDLFVDVGTGAGLLALAAGRRFPAARVLGVDVAVEALGPAALAADAAGLNGVEFAEGDAEALPVGQGEARVVAALSAFNLFPDKVAFLAEARRALAPGGTLVVAEAFHGYDAPFQAGPGPLGGRAFRAIVRASGLVHESSRDVTDVRKALDAAKAWRYPAFVDGFSFRIETIRRGI